MGLTEKEILVLQLRARGLTQVEVAKRLKVSQAAVSGFEQNAHKKIIDAQNVVALAAQMGLKGVRK